jgi:hypothetical protein
MAHERISASDRRSRRKLRSSEAGLAGPQEDGPPAQEDEVGGHHPGGQRVGIPFGAGHHHPTGVVGNVEGAGQERDHRLQGGGDQVLVGHPEVSLLPPLANLGLKRDEYLEEDGGKRHSFAHKIGDEPVGGAGVTRGSRGQDGEARWLPRVVGVVEPGGHGPFLAGAGKSE